MDEQWQESNQNNRFIRGHRSEFSQLLDARDYDPIEGELNLSDTEFEQGLDIYFCG